jgi:monoamine oxidase
LPGASRYSLGAISYSWSQDLWAQGGWAYPTKSQEKRLFNELSKPEGRIFLLENTRQAPEDGYKAL